MGVLMATKKKAIQIHVDLADVRGTCRHCHAYEPPEIDKIHGECRLSAPTLYFGEDDFASGHRVKETHWCLDFRSKH